MREATSRKEQTPAKDGGKRKGGRIQMTDRAAKILLATVMSLAFTGCVSSGPSTGAVGRGGCTAGDPRYAGHYYLNGVMEVGSELLLRPDGSFEFMLAYGANDQRGKGCWVARGSTLEVIPAGRSAASRTHTPDDRGFGGLVLAISGRDLVWDIAGSGHKGRYQKG